MSAGNCRFCGSVLEHSFCDLGMSPLANAFLRGDGLQQMEPCYPLHAYVCGECFLVQLGEFESPQKLFGDYAYFSSYSETWLRHAQAYAEEMVSRFGLGRRHQVVEIASNDGYLLRYFREKGIPVLGVEPAANVAAVAEAGGIPTLVRFFGTSTARDLAAQGRQADLLVGNNVLAHVPELNDFVAGMKLVLKRGGVVTMEFPHLLRMMEQNQFDTIYHEHFSYFSLTTVERVFARHGLTLFDVQELRTHGGSLRIFAAHRENEGIAISSRPAEVKAREAEAGLSNLATYRAFEQRVHAAKWKLLQCLIEAKQAGKRIVAYGAAAKGNTLLNYCGIGGDFIDYAVDRSPHKQGRYTPLTHIPVFPPEKVRETRPDYLLILSWNLKEEVMAQMGDIRAWGGRFIVPIPEAMVLS